MSYVFLPDAQEEMLEAAIRYEKEQERLGSLFTDEVEAVVQKILANPLLWHQRRDGHRRVNCPVFPYVAYFIRAQTIVIAAVGHVKRKPGYWKQRVAS